MTQKTGPSGLFLDTKLPAGTANGRLPAPAQFAPTNPAGTTSLTGVMMGLGAQGTPVQYTPVWTGRIRVTVFGDFSNNTAGDGATELLRYGTGAAPANGAALTGTAPTANQPIMSISGQTQQVPAPLYAVITGLTLGTAYWFDLVLAAVTGGTATATKIVVTIEEF